MAHYVQIPKDLNDIKEKFIMGFTKRQVICFGIGLALGAPVFFAARNFVGMSTAIVAMGIVRYYADCTVKTVYFSKNRQNICVNISPDHASDITKQQIFSCALKDTWNTTR